MSSFFLAIRSNDFRPRRVNPGVMRGTPHGQGNFSKNPVRLLTTFTPGGFDLFFKDRVELFKTVKPGDSAFKKKFDELREKHRKWFEILGTWDIQK